MLEWNVYLNGVPSGIRPLVAEVLGFVISGEAWVSKRSVSAPQAHTDLRLGLPLYHTRLSRPTQAGTGWP
jgi:hypothetical protein